MDETHSSMLFDRASVPADSLGGADCGTAMVFWMGSQPWLKVNLNGERFCNESGPYDYMLHSTIMQPHQTYVDIWDANHAAQAEAFDEVGCCRLFPFPNGAKNNIPMQVVDGMIDKLIEDGYVQKADTMEELAEKLGVPADALEKTVADYNGYVEAGVADPFGRVSYGTKIATGPFFAYPRKPAVHHTMGGVRIDGEAHALSGEGAEVLNKEAKNTAPTDQQAADDTDKDNDGFPDGSYDLLMIGDSVSLRAVDTFDGVFLHSHIDAEKGLSLIHI